MTTPQIIEIALFAGWVLVIILLSARFVSYLRWERCLRRARLRWENAKDSAVYAKSPLTVEQQEQLAREFLASIQEYKELLRKESK